MDRPFEILENEIVNCQLCSRLRQHCTKVATVKRRAYRDWEYWGRPVPAFGDPQARILILGLAPGAHGSNRTGRMFTGDRSGEILYRTLHKTGLASQASSLSRDDGLVLHDVFITAAARCAPPGNKPTPAEIRNCRPFLERELELLKNVKVVVALGKIAFDAYLNFLKRRGLLPTRKEFAFRHGACYAMADGKTLLASYHPSNQNTQTGKLTRKMFLAIFKEAARLADG